MYSQGYQLYGLTERELAEDLIHAINMRDTFTDGRVPNDVRLNLVLLIHEHARRVNKRRKIMATKSVTTKVTKKADKKGSIQFVQATDKDRLPGIYIPRDILVELDNAEGDKNVKVIFEIDE